MTAPTASLSDTSSWLPLDGLAPGFDANKAPHTPMLDGRELVLLDERGTRIRHRFTADTVAWAYEPGPEDPNPAGADSDEYEAFLVAEELVFVQFRHRSLPHETVSLALDLAAGRALAVLSVLGEPGPGVPAMRQIFSPAIIEGAEQRGPAPAPTATLIGRRALWVYSERHAYEHVYLSPHWYSWQCLAGPERGLADTDEVSAWSIRPGIVVFAWREKVIPCGSVTIADHRDPRALRSHGVLFGRDGAGTGHSHFTFGAAGRLLSVTAHPGELDPAG